MNVVDQLTVLVATYGASALGGVVILVVGWTLAGWVARGLDASLARLGRVDATLRRFTASLARYAILTFTVLAVLSRFGIQTASLIAVFGAAGLAIGLALQGTLANLASGVMILVFRPFKVGDDVEAAGSRGTVEAIDLFSTELRRPDNVQLVMPNGKIWGQPITNYSAHKTRRLELKVVVGETVEIEDAVGALRSTLASESRALPDPAPTVTVSELAENSVTLAIQVWCSAEDHEDLKVTLMKSLKRALKTGLKTASS